MEAEPGKDRFQLVDTPDAATSATYGPQAIEDVPIGQSFAAEPEAPGLETTAAVVQDTRAPLGRDAGAPEATFADAAGGGSGWQGGAEDEAGIAKAAEEEVVATSVVLEEKPKKVELDAEQEALVNQALLADQD